MLGLVLSICVIGWIIAACTVFSQKERIPINLKMEIGINDVAVLFLALTILCAIIGYLKGEDFFANLATSFGSIAVTVFLIDSLNAQRALKQRKQEIIEEMESPVRDVAVEAIRLARKYGWLNEALKKVYLRNSQLAGADLSDANLQGKVLSYVNLQEAILSAAQLQGAILNNANLQEANLFRAQLQGAILNNANLEGAILNDAQLQEAILNNANLQEAILSGANLKGAILNDAQLQRSQLLRANLQEADLSGVQMQGATYNYDTLWPKGVDPQAFGAILVEF